jgi:phosphate transport system permease protein
MIMMMSKGTDKFDKEGSVKDGLRNTRNGTYINKKLRSVLERVSENVFLLCACISVLSVVIISVYIFAKGIPIFFKVGFKEIIFGMEWKPLEGKYGLFPMIIASLLVTFGAVAIGVTIGLMTAILLAEISPQKFSKIIRPAVELLAGIPSVVYGFFGLIVIVPVIDKSFGGGGNSLLAGIIILGIMILPTIISIAETSIRAVPKEYKEGSLALGASHIQTIFKVILPAARSGIMAAVVLGMGRAIGETMAAILVIGNTPLIPHSIFDRVRTLTSNIAIEMSYAQGMHQEALLATGVVLFVFIMILNILLNVFIRKAGEA